ncbi:MAG: DegT/DnrJ/EryC1/StrS family aminotransferase, partial [Cyanobacteria bacterium]|nr:DegT/DnrJ/EryC1/StrS family aminotransferase [Cyanobacteriota bacterium]
SRNFGIQGESSILASGINGKMNEIQACIGLSVLKHVPQERQKRKKLIQAYRNKLAQIPGLQMMEPLDPETIQPSYQYFAIRIHPDTYGLHRDQVIEKLKQYNIFARRYFYPLCSSYPHYQDLPSSNPENLRVAQLVSEQVLCLPLYGKLTVSDVDRICTCLKMFQTNNYSKALPIEEKALAPQPSKEIALR